MIGIYKEWQEMIKVRCRDTFASDDINRSKETSTNESHFCDFDPESHRVEIKDRLLFVQICYTRSTAHNSWQGSKMLELDRQTPY